MKEPRHAPINLFSVRRSQAIFALIVWPELLTLPIKFTSEAAGVSMGIAFQTIALLKDSGYIAGTAAPELVRKNELIDRWTEAYASGLGKKLLLGRFRGESTDPSGLVSDAPFFVSGESAVPTLLTPTTLTVYVAEVNSRLIVANRWRADGQPTIEVRKKFWTAPSQILPEQHRSRDTTAPHETPSLLIYADLMASGDGRQREAARTFRKEHRELVDG